MQTRPFGQTGASLPILSFGAQRVVDEEGCSQDQAIEILNTALDRRIRYFDTAWAYSRGQSEERVAFFQEMLPLVKPQNLPWKASDWDHPTEWKPRHEPDGYGIWR